MNSSGAADDGAFDCMGGGGGDTNSSSGPRMLTCYICGTQHGLASLEIHQKQCLVKRAKSQQVLPAQQQSAVPTAPAMAVPGSKAKSAAIEAYNTAAQTAFNSTMPKCGKCGRTFDTHDKLQKHAGACKGTNKGGSGGGGGGGRGGGGGMNSSGAADDGAFDCMA